MPHPLCRHDVPELMQQHDAEHDQAFDEPIRPRQAEQQQQKQPVDAKLHAPQTDSSFTRAHRPDSSVTVTSSAIRPTNPGQRKNGQST